MPREDKYMRRCLQLASLGRGFVSPNPMVGAVVVKSGEVVGEGYHERYGTPHGEVNALLSAGGKAKGATLYVNLEPCNHYGQTPPCTQEIIKAGVKKVILSMIDPNPLVSGAGVRKLRDAGVNVEVGLLEEEARKLNECYIKYITTKVPFVMMKIASTLDGK